MALIYFSTIFEINLCYDNRFHCINQSQNVILETCHYFVLDTDSQKCDAAVYGCMTKITQITNNTKHEHSDRNSSRATTKRTTTTMRTKLRRRRRRSDENEPRRRSDNDEATTMKRRKTIWMCVSTYLRRKDLNRKKENEGE